MGPGVIERYGDLFTSDAKYLGHGCNVKGMMGAGIANAFREHFPDMYAKYKVLCRAYALSPGSYYAVAEKNEVLGERVIVNFASQNVPGRDATYDWLFSALRQWASVASFPDRIARHGNRIAIPEIGCGIGGLEWELVKFVIECIENMYPEIEFEVWHYKETI